jgi:long-chain fatty acid transport protein
MRKITLTILLCLPFLVNAGGFQLNVQGIKAIAMGGAFTGVSTDASCVYFNPGGMSNFEGKHNFILGFNVIDPYASLQTEVNSNIDQTTGKATPFHFYYVGELNEKIRLGFLVNNQFGSASSFEDDWQGRFIVQNISLKSFMFQPTLSYKIHDKITIGAGFVYTMGTFSYEKGVPVGSETTTEGKGSLSGKGDGTSYNVGVFSNLFTLKHDSATTDFSVGVNYRSGIRIDLPEGEAVFTDIPVSLQDKFPTSTNFSGTLNLPSVFTIGISAKHNRANYSLTFAYDYNYTGWSSYDTLAFDYVNEDTPDTKVAKNWQNTSTHRFGLDFTYKKKYSVRIGVSIDKTPIPDGYLSPELPGMDQIAYAGGLGYKVNDKISVDFSYIRLSGERESGLDDAGFSAKYRRIANVYGLGLNLKLGGKKKEAAPSI